MTKPLRIALTADLHWGPHGHGNDATQLLIASLQDKPPDLLILGGDVGAGHRFAECLALFDGLACRKALIPGNHDIWVEAGDARGDSLTVYRDYLPSLCREH